MLNKEEFIKLIEEVSRKERLAGTKGETKAFDYVKRYIRKNVGGKINLQKYKILTWRETEKPSVTVDGKEINCKSLYYNPTTKIIKGKLEYFEKNNTEDDNKFEVYCVRDKRGNVLAMFYVSVMFKEPFYYNNGGATYLLPIFIVGSDFKDFFNKSIGKYISISLKTRYVVKKSANLIHKIKNREDRFKIIIGAHVDTVPGSKGVLDNASGVVSALLLSSELKKTKLPFDVWFIYFGSEENSMFGSKFFVDTLTKEEKEKIKYVISIDGLGIGEKIWASVEKDYFPQIRNAFKDVGEKLILTDIEKSIDISDQYYFKLSGIDSFFLGGKAKSFYFHNKEADKIANLNVELCLNATKSIADFVKNIKFKSPNINF